MSRDPENVEPYIKTNPTSKINDCLEGKNGWEGTYYVNVTEFLFYQPFQDSWNMGSAKRFIYKYCNG